MGSASQAVAAGAGAVSSVPSPNADGWITSSGATVTVRFSVHGFASSPHSSGSYDELINNIECSGPGVSGGGFSGPGVLDGAGSGSVSTVLTVSGDSASPAGTNVGCTATYQMLAYSSCGLFGCTSTPTNPSTTISNDKTLKIDSSPPVNIVGHPAHAAAADNWHNVATVVDFTGEDANSGIKQCSHNVTLAGPSSKATKFASGSCTNVAGLQSGSGYVYRYDDTPPTLAPTVSADPVVLGADVTADPHATDLHSGIASASCDKPDTSTLGTHTVHCTATDVATNSAGADVTYEVVPAPVTDQDGDGVSDDVDQCPTENGGGSANGCPAVPDPPATTGDPVPTGDTVPTTSDPAPPVLEQPRQPDQPATPVTPFSGSLAAIKGGSMKKAALKKAYPLGVTCTADSNASVALTVTSSMAKKLKLKVPKGQKTVTIGSAAGQCKGSGGGKLMLSLERSAKTKLLQSKGAIPATVTLQWTKPGSRPFKMSRSLKLT